ncbi:MAG: hypothetical protein IJW15_01060 [Clostridia bacterium]|nr:hypothetical protein [Clostridia bacterium]
MLLWDYQDEGYTHYRIKTNGDNCEECTKLDGKVFPLGEANMGENLMPFHPNCDCFVEVLHKNQNTAVVASPNTEYGEGANPLGYLRTSLKQIILGNYAEDVNLGGILGQIGLGLLGVDLPADIRDIFYDITNFEVSTEHIVQTLMDVFAVLPLIGGLKYTDEGLDVLKSAVKHGDEAAEASKITKRELLLERTTNQKLKNAINEMYRENAKIGDGGLSDAIRYELQTGELISGRSHIQKGKERLKNLENILEKQELNITDKETTMNLIEDLKKALEGKQYDK